MASYQMQITIGMPVVGSDGKEIGTVKEVRSNDFLVNRRLARDVYVPFSAIQSISDGRIILNVASDQVDRQGWAHPPLAGMAGR